MEIAPEIVRQAWERAAGQCECNQREHPHFYVPCGKPLVYENRGRKMWGGWQIKRVDEGKTDTAANCDVLCMTCYEMNY